MELKQLKRLGEYQWEIPMDKDMRVPAFIFASRELVSEMDEKVREQLSNCLLYTSPSPRDRQKSRMPSSA